jgi:hypothetical protein
VPAILPWLESPVADTSISVASGLHPSARWAARLNTSATPPGRGATEDLPDDAKADAFRRQIRPNRVPELMEGVPPDLFRVAGSVNGQADVVRE